MTQPTSAPAPTRLRQVATRSAALLRDAVNPTRVIAWLCPRCGRWVPPGRFSATAGVCRTCTQALDPERR